MIVLDMDDAQCTTMDRLEKRVRCYGIKAAWWYWKLEML